ncbi:MAG TPA: flagellar motor protein MotD [Gammaproteobacteria bacterium]|nr:flagellar motor protein MotD [Gammaproteobacteria bacterium]
MARKQKHEEHVNHERWLVSYADFITLLFAFFVVMYAISSVNQGKYRVLSDALVAAFRSAPKTLEPIQVGEPSKSPASPSPNVRDKPTVVQPPRPPLPRPLSPFPPDTPKGRKPLPDSQGKVVAPQGAMQQHAPTDQGETAAPLQEIARQIKEALGQLEEAKLIEVRSERQRVEIELKASILFVSGSARVQPDAVPILERIAAILTPFSNPIEVSGYTDNDPIRSFVFPSNWELSAARAASVVHLFADSGVSPERMAAIGYGEYQPVADNDTPEGRSKNRRVILAILAEPAQAPDLQEFKPEPKPVQVANKPEQAPANPLHSAGETAVPTGATASLLMMGKTAPAPTVLPVEVPAWLKLTEPAGAAAPPPALLKPSVSYGETQVQAKPAPVTTPSVSLPARTQPLAPASSLSPIAPIAPIARPLAPIIAAPLVHPAAPWSPIRLPAQTSPAQLTLPAPPPAQVSPAPVPMAPPAPPPAPPQNKDTPDSQILGNIPAPVPKASSEPPVNPVPLVQPATPRAPVEFSRAPQSVRPAFPQQIAPPIQLPFSSGLVRPPIAIGITKPAASGAPAQGAGK